MLLLDRGHTAVKGTTCTLQAKHKPKCFVEACLNYTLVRKLSWEAKTKENKLPLHPGTWLPSDTNRIISAGAVADFASVRG